ncbi:MAG: GNAT family N-acetyltransferase [Oscillospiraceae bacterium]|nr:GNAT family N-acetyltransferase [Oscillospiraceae bacterium]
MMETERLFIRPFEHGDIDLIYRIYSDEEILRYTPFDVKNRKQAEAHLTAIIKDWDAEPRLSYEMAVILKKTAEKIGRTHILIDPETDTGMIGTLLIQEHWGHHYATEVSEALLDFCFTHLKLHRVNAVCNPDNTASWHMLEKIGLRREALLRQKCRYVKNGNQSWHDELEYAILESEYLPRSGNGMQISGCRKRGEPCNSESGYTIIHTVQREAIDDSPVGRRDKIGQD